jgi:hypothetical protein
MTARCRVPGCLGAIIWAKTPAGANMPVDADSAGRGGGNLAVWRDGGRAGAQLYARVLTAGEQPDPKRGEHLGTCHWGTCTNAEAARKRCSGCGHLTHTEPCKVQGKVTCQRVKTDAGTAVLRGRFPCGCELLAVA